MMKMMCNTGISELTGLHNLVWLMDTLALNATEEEAGATFEKCISEAVNSMVTPINNFIHIKAH